VYAALAYYHGHRSEIDADIEADERLVAEMKATAGAPKLEEKLSQRYGKDNTLLPG
jgi:hypothetical protein